MILPKYIGYVFGLLLLLQGLSCFGQTKDKNRGFAYYPSLKDDIYWPQEKIDSIQKEGKIIAQKKVLKAIGSRLEVLSFDSSLMYLNHLPENICELTTLKELNLYGIVVSQDIDSSLKAKLGKCNLVFLENKIPDILFCLSELEVLNLGLNPIAIVPEEIGQLQNL
ncbi:MAG: hypothetical protein GY810_28480 [Aureispira sp.]|nr:hypothetical protein [Aureispira sp.]